MLIETVKAGMSAEAVSGVGGGGGGGGNGKRKVVACTRVGEKAALTITHALVSCRFTHSIQPRATFQVGIEFAYRGSVDLEKKMHRSYLPTDARRCATSPTRLLQ